MSKLNRDKVMLAEHILEIRHNASGTFLDIRGYIADYIKGKGLFPHWNIETNVVNFRDNPEKIISEGAFIGYKNAGYVSLNPQTRNYFTDRATSFCKSLLEQKTYKIPKPTRFGTRTKIFVPSIESFDKINASFFETLFTEKARTLIGGKATDSQFAIELIEGSFNVRIVGRPIHKDKARRYFQFDSEHFTQCGLFLDLDYFMTDNFELSNVTKLLPEAINFTWRKAEHISSGVGL
jgi:hypothetical protein